VGRYFEEFTVGSEIVSGGQTLTLESMIAFAALYDPQSFHIDVEAGKKSPYGGLIASGFQTLAVASACFSIPPCWPAPALVRTRWTICAGCARCGGRYAAHGRARHRSTASASKPDRGIVRAAFRVINQQEEDVLTFATTVFVARRPN